MTEDDRAIAAAQIVELCGHVQQMAQLIAETRAAIAQQSAVLDELITGLHSTTRRVNALQAWHGVHVPAIVAVPDENDELQMEALH